MSKECCPNCGDIVGNLNPVTGWCKACTELHHPYLGVCVNCGKPFAADQKRDKCSNCRRKDSLIRVADRIELYMMMGLPYVYAKQQVEFEKSPICVCCGTRIRNGTNGTHVFCRDKPECRKAARRYKWYREHYKLSREEALERTIQSLKEVA